jgi:transcriptional regulator of heat shock response
MLDHRSKNKNEILKFILTYYKQTEKPVGVKVIVRYTGIGIATVYSIIKELEEEKKIHSKKAQEQLGRYRSIVVIPL